MKRCVAFLVLAFTAFAFGLAVVRWQRPTRFFQVLERVALRLPPDGCGGLEEGGPLVIAHAGGAVGTETYSNSLEALDLSYREGCRLFELDFEWTEDGELVLLHDWNANATRIFGPEFGGRWHTRDVFLSAARLDGLTSLDFEALVSWLDRHADARVVTDVKAGNSRALVIMKEGIPRADQVLIPQIYGFDEYEPTRKLGFDRIILTLYRSDASDDQVLAFCARHDLWAVAMPAPRATRGLSQALAAIGVPALVHTVNSPHHAGYLRRLGVRGIFSDHLVACGGPAW